MVGMGVLMRMILLSFIKEWHTNISDYLIKPIVAGEFVKIFGDNREQKKCVLV